MIAPRLAGAHAALAARLEAEAPALDARVVGLEYTDPFWAARYGDRGRRFAREDDLHHLRYVLEARHAGEAAWRDAARAA